MTFPPEIPATRRPVVSDEALALIVYVLYGVGSFSAVPALVGVIIAHVKVRDAEPWLQSHYQFLIRTFWIGLVYTLIGFLLCLVLIGFPILIWAFVWSLIRIIKGIILFNEGKPISNPRSWMFGEPRVVAPSRAGDGFRA